MDNSKWIGKSLTFWGIAVTFLSTVLPAVGPFIGLDVTPGEVSEVGTSVTTALQAIGGAIGTVMAIIGRMRAKAPATLLGS
jgi:hypothetical protein